MAAVQLGAKPIGSEVKVKINGVATTFLVVHHGKPSSMYDDSFNGGTIVMMKNLYETRAWHNSNTNDWANSNLKSYLDSSFYSLIDANIRGQIKQVKVPYRASSGTSTAVSSGTSGLSCKVFLPSAYEMGWLNSDSRYFPADGARWAYFDAGTGTTANNKRIAYLNGTAIYWWLRSPDTINSTNACSVSPTGYYSDGGCTNVCGIRPAFVLPQTLLVDDTGTVFANTAPTVPPSITIPDTIRGGTSIDISWGAASDADGNLTGYKVERSLNGGEWTQIYQGTALTTPNTVPFGSATIAYRVKAYDEYGMESTYQTSPTKTVINNLAPTKPSNIIVPVNVLGGEQLTVSWSASTDSDGNLSGYELQLSVDGGAWTQVYRGSTLYYADTITRGWNTVKYRVCAYDTDGATSDWLESAQRTVDNSRPPVITSATSGDIGTKDDAFSWAYTITHPDSTATTVTEAMDGVTTRTYTATLGAAATFNVPRASFIELLNGPHTMTVTATAAGRSVTHTVTFTKGVYTLSITLDEPLPAAAPITKMVMNITRNIPADANFQVLVTNNANDASPVWEDATQAVISGTNFVFTNTVLSGDPAFNFKVLASRGASNTGGSVQVVGGAFE